MVSIPAGTEMYNSISRVHVLRTARQSSYTLVRRESAKALGKVGPDAREAVPGLITACGDPEWTVRREAALALGAIEADDRQAVAALEKLRKDPDALVRKAAR